MKTVYYASTMVMTALLCFPIQEAHAYIGPGAGLTAIGTVIALIGGLLLGVIGFVWYPIKRLLKAKRKTTAKPAIVPPLAAGGNSLDQTALPPKRGQ